METTEKKPITLLIDGDQFLYRATVSAEKEVKWDSENWVLHANEEESYDTFKRSLANEVKRIEEFLDCDTIPLESQWVAFSLGDSFRIDLYPGYKGGRKDYRKPLCYWTVKDRVAKRYRIKEVASLEADDIMGIWSTSNHNGVRIIVSVDKDMQTIPGLLWRNNEVLEISQEAADRYWMFQTLTGDVTDGYPGLVGVGETRANRILDGASGLHTMWSRVSEAYTKSGASIDDAVVQARCARILRASDYVDKTLKLWSPE